MRKQRKTGIIRHFYATCNSQKSKSSGLAKHFMDGCPFDIGKEKTTLVISLIDFYDTTEEKLVYNTVIVPENKL